MRQWLLQGLSRPRRSRYFLAIDEALIFWLAGEKETYVFALTHEAFVWKTMPLAAEALGRQIAVFRRGLDVGALARGLQRTECMQETDKRGLARAECAQA